MAIVAMVIGNTALIFKEGGFWASHAEDYGLHPALLDAASRRGSDTTATLTVRFVAAAGAAAKGVKRLMLSTPLRV